MQNMLEQKVLIWIGEIFSIAYLLPTTFSFSCFYFLRSVVPDVWTDAIGKEHVIVYLELYIFELH